MMRWSVVYCAAFSFATATAADAQRLYGTLTQAVAVGDTDGNGPTVFGRIADAEVDSKGRILVLDQLASEIRIFDERGRFLSRFGRSGKGPGELSGGVTDLLIGAGDTLFVPDPNQARISVFTSAGQLVRTITFRPQPRGQSWSLGADGSFFFRGITIERSPEGKFNVGDGLFRRSASGEPLSTIALLDYPHSDIGGPGKPLVPVIVNGAFWARLPDGRMAWSSLDRERVLLLDANGQVSDSLTHPAWKAAPITTSDRDVLRRLLKAKLHLLGGDLSVADGPLVTFPERLPAITGLRAGPGGTLWVQSMGRLDSAEPMAINATDHSEWLGGTTWYVFGSDRAFRGTVALPPRTRVTDLGADYVLAIRRDDLDVESVVKYRLTRK